MNLLGTAVIVLTLTQCLVHSAAPGIKSNYLSQRDSRIVGGHAAVPHSHPYIISLQLQVLWISAHFCGGSLVSEKWVVTAAHCVTESYLIRWLDICAMAGAQDVDKITERVQIQKIVERNPHPDYKGGVGPNDIAMLRTEHPFKYSAAVQPIRLPPQNVNLTSGSLVLSGWGVIKSAYFFPILPDQLQELNVTYVPYKKCSKQVDYFTEFYEENTLNKESNICTGPLEGGKAACSGDSGGPLTLIVSSNSDTKESSSQSTSTTESSTTSKTSTTPKSSTTTECSTTSETSTTPKSSTTTECSTTSETSTTPKSSTTTESSKIEVVTSKSSTTPKLTTTTKSSTTKQYITTLESSTTSESSTTTESNKRNNNDINSNSSSGSSSGNYIEYLVGVVSWGIYPCGEHGAPTVYTDVSTYRDFIMRYMNSDG